MAQKRHDEGKEFLMHDTDDTDTVGANVGGSAVGSVQGRTQKDCWFDRSCFCTSVNRKDSSDAYKLFKDRSSCDIH